MKIEVLLSKEENANLIKNIYPLYLYDLSEFDGNFTNAFGIYEEEPIKTLAEQYECQNVWWERPEALFPFIIMVDDKPAGFDLVAAKPHAPEGADYYIYESFLLRPYRGKGIAEYAASKIFETFFGKWEVYANPKNARAQHFWRKTISNYTSGIYSEEYGETFDGYKLIFRFDNATFKDRKSVSS